MSLTFEYIVNGTAAIKRIVPLLQERERLGLDFVPFQSGEEDSSGPIGLVWETTCSKSYRRLHSSAIVLNRLHNSQVLENKASLAVLQTRLTSQEGVIPTHIASSFEEVARWAKMKWSNGNEHDEEDDWWVVKAAGGNGGKDIWVINGLTWQEMVSTELLHRSHSSELYVIQRYIQQPMLWRGRKFHLRCYTLLKGNMQTYVYRKAFILSASDSYDTNSSHDSLKHITNLSVNKGSPSHPGQVPTDLMTDFPFAFEALQRIWGNLILAATPFMSRQVSPHHFDFYGIDIMIDANQGSWLLECNRLPGLDSSKNNKEAEDEMYNEMMTSLLRLVSHPALLSLPEPEEEGWCEIHHRSDDSSAQGLGGSQGPPYLNLLNWMAFYKRNAVGLSVSQ